MVNTYQGIGNIFKVIVSEIFSEKIEKQEYETSRGSVVLSSDGKQAVAKIDGRYPDKELGFSINTQCIENIKIMRGWCVLETKSGISLLSKGDSYTVETNNAYGMSGKAIAHITITPQRNSQQNIFSKTL